MDKPYSRKQGDTYPVRAQILDAAGAVDLESASEIVLRMASRARNGSPAAIVAEAVGAKVAGQPGWAVFEDVADIADLAPAVYDFEISYTIDGKIVTTKTGGFEILRQLG